MGNATTSTNGPELVVTSVKVERDVYEAFRRVADANRRSISQELRWVIDRHVEANPLQEAA